MTPLVDISPLLEGTRAMVLVVLLFWLAQLRYVQTRNGFRVWIVKGAVPLDWLLLAIVLFLSSIWIAS